MSYHWHISFTEASALTEAAKKLADKAAEKADQTPDGKLTSCD